MAEREGERIYVRTEAGGLELLTEKRFESEGTLQKLLADYPELLEGTQINPKNPRRWILITREQGIAVTGDAADRWSLDVLVIDQDATPTLVEVKLGSNSDVRRKVVGQMLDYAAHAHNLNVDDLRKTFDAQSGAEQRMDALLKDKETDPDTFWGDVAENLKDRNIRLLFVADAIPDELTHIVEFLNEQMGRIEVLAVEVKRFEGNLPQTFMPRVIGQPDGSQAGSASGGKPRQKLTLKAFMNQIGDATVQDAATRLLNASSECGARLTWGTSSVSIRMRCSTWAKRNTPTSVCWIFLPGSSGPVPTNGTAFTFGTGDMHANNIPDSVRAALEQWTGQLGQLGEAGVMEDISTGPYHTWTVSYEDAAQHIDTLEGYLRDVLTKLKNL